MEITKKQKRKVLAEIVTYLEKDNLDSRYFTRTNLDYYNFENLLNNFSHTSEYIFKLLTKKNKTQ